MDLYPVVKSLHIIFVVTWFAGLFYIVRLFVNHTEALQKQEPDRKILIEQFKKMEKPLWVGITYPSMILAVAFGTTMFFMNPVLIHSTYMHLKLTFVALLLIYHFYCGKLYFDYQKHIASKSSFSLRILNEIASVFLVAIVFIIILKTQLNFGYFFGGLGAFCLLLLYVIVRFNQKRNNN